MNWRVALCIDPSVLDGFRALLLAGDAEIVGLEYVLAPSPFCRKLDLLLDSFPFPPKAKITHAFFDVRRITNKEQEISALEAAGVPCLKPEFISEFLAEEKPPELARFRVL
jgi:hypothetical protein